VTKTHFLGTKATTAGTSRIQGLHERTQLSCIASQPYISISRRESRTMRLLVLVAAVALVTCESSPGHETLSEMREEIAQMKAEVKQFAEMQAEIKKIAQLEEAKTATPVRAA
jgi:hypothetical protein